MIKENRYDCSCTVSLIYVVWDDMSRVMVADLNSYQRILRKSFLVARLENDDFKFRGTTLVPTRYCRDDLIDEWQVRTLFVLLLDYKRV